MSCDSERPRPAWRCWRSARCVPTNPGCPGDLPWLATAMLPLASRTWATEGAQGCMSSSAQQVGHLVAALDRHGRDRSPLATDCARLARGNPAGGRWNHVQQRERHHHHHGDQHRQTKQPLGLVRHARLFSSAISAPRRPGLVQRFISLSASANWPRPCRSCGWQWWRES